MADLMRSLHRRADAQVIMSDDHWRLFVLQGGGLILFGIAAAALPNITSLAPGALVGWLLLMSGLFRLACGFGTQIGPGHWSSMLLSALMIPAGAVLAFYPTTSTFEVTIALAAYLTLHAIASLILAASLRDETSRWLAILGGSLFDLLLAALTLADWPSTANWVFGFYLGLNLAVAGLALLFAAFGVRNALHPA